MGHPQGLLHSPAERRERNYLEIDVLRLNSDQLVCDGEEREFQSGRNAGLIEDIRQMPFHRFFADAELLGDVAIAAAFHDAAHHFQLARRQPIGLALGNGGLLHQLMQRANQVHHPLAANPIVAR